MEQLHNQDVETENAITRPRHKLAHVVCMTLLLIFVLAMAIPSAEAVPVADYPRPRSPEVLAHFCQATPVATRPTPNVAVPDAYPPFYIRP